MKSELTIIPKISIHPDKICSYNELNWYPSKPSRTNMPLPFQCYSENYERIKNSTRSANGNVSKHAKRKLARALDYLLLMSAPKTGTVPKSGKKFQFRIVFVTIDLPSQQIHTDNEIKAKCWNSFLIELTKYHHVHNYLWRAEKQKNGNLHFHLIIDKFILYNELRKRWNRIINKLGYVDRYQENQMQFHADGFRLRPELLKHWTADQQKKAYLTGVKSNWTSPNSTDIHSIKHISNIKSYISKYMVKNEKEKETNQSISTDPKYVCGRIWGCNQKLSDIKGSQLDVDTEVSNELKKLIDITKCHKYEDTYISVYYIDINQLARFSPGVLFKYFSSYLIKHFNYSSQLFLG
jgi:hypothetical protein